jgi:hypothetical protein
MILIILELRVSHSFIVIEFTERGSFPVIISYTSAAIMAGYVISR